MQGAKFKTKEAKFNVAKNIRNSIKLNKSNQRQYIYFESIVADNSLWTNYWLDQSNELKTESNSIKTTPSKKVKLLVKWWEN